MAFELGKFQTAEQRRNAQQLAQADAPMAQSTTLRGQQNTSPLGMPQDVGSKVMQTAITRSAMGLKGPAAKDKSAMPQDVASKAMQQAIFDNAFGAYRRGDPLTPVPQVTPAERARESEVQRMAQQYGGNDMRLALMEKAPGETPEDLVKFYQAQRSAGQDETMKQEMVNYFSQQEAFANSQFGGEKAAQMFVDQNPDIAFREFNKNVPLEVISKGDEQSLRTSPSTESFGDGEGGMDMSIDMNKAAVMRTYNQDNAYQVHKDATPTQSLKTDFTGLADQPDVNAEKPRLMASPFAAANKQTFDLLGIESTFGEDALGEDQFMRLKQRLESIKGNKGFSYDR